MTLIDKKLQELQMLFNKGAHQKSIEELEQLSAEYPNEGKVILQLAFNHFKLMDWPKANNYIEKLVRQFGSQEYYLHCAVDFYLQTSQYLKAIPVQERICEDKGDHNQKHKLAMLYIKSFAHDKAHGLYKEILANKPDDIYAIGVLADIEHGDGNFSQAIDLYKHILDIQPNSATALYGIVKSTKFKNVDTHIEKIATQIIENALVGDDQKIEAHMALGKMYDDCNMHDKAWLHWSQGNSLQSKLFPYDGKQVDEQVKLIKESFTSELLSKYQHKGNQDVSPIFIVGMPRSGTTLLEQVLERSGCICAAGESPALNKAVNGRLYNIRFPQDIGLAPASLFADLASDYLDYIANCHVEGKLRSVDKLPGNFLYLGLLKLMFPNMKVINMKRNKQDNALSIFANMFSNHMTFTNTLEGIAHMQELHDDMMEHWQGIFSDNILSLDYEEFVSNFETQAREVFDFTGLEWNDSVVDFVNSKNKVFTPSSYQVRQGINTKAINRSDPYLKKLAEC
ncbi:tetratricopeptide repeat-containing sulfotransferase family protein [Pseudoalteromonas sp. SSDWG2]|uniref:tetratricopeptide repeat-containing sulfotransferase family protein n=1 Tax=Pseudoalteromonas sp. SSDWG2 TaxID=3139391 RepID=UPI003BADAB5B